MICQTTLNFYTVHLALVGLHIFFVGAFPPQNQQNLDLEDDGNINEKLEFLKLSQKGCSQAVFIHGQKELNCTISIWYTGTFSMWMLRDDIVRDLGKATEQELRTLPVQLCTCNKVQVSDLCPSETHEITNILLHSCKDSDQDSSGVPMGGVVADLIKMVNDVRKLENISTVLEAFKKDNSQDVEFNDHGKSPNDKKDSLENKNEAVDIGKARSNAKDEDDFKQGMTEEESKGINSEDEETTGDDGTERKDEDGESIDEDVSNNENVKHEDVKLDVDNNVEAKPSVKQIKTAPKKQKVNVKKINDDSIKEITGDDINEDDETERNEDLEVDDKLIEDDLSKDIAENDNKSDKENISEENGDDSDDLETDNKVKTDVDINKAEKEHTEDEEIINKEKTHNFNEAVDEKHSATIVEDEVIVTESTEGEENRMIEEEQSNNADDDTDDEMDD